MIGSQIFPPENKGFVTGSLKNVPPACIEEFFMADSDILEISLNLKLQQAAPQPALLARGNKTEFYTTPFLVGRLGLTLRKLLNGDASEVPHYESCSFLA